MDLGRQANLANIGSFFVGCGCFVLACVMVYLAFHPIVPTSAPAGTSMAKQGATDAPLERGGQSSSGREVATPPLMWVLIGGLVLAGGLHLFAAIAQRSIATLHQSPASVISSSRIVAQVTLEYLVELCSGKTSLQMEDAAKPFIDKWINVSGIVQDVRKRTESDTAVSFKYTGKADPDMLFDTGVWLEHLSIIKLGDYLAVTGQIKAISGQMVWLQHCEIVEYKGESPTPHDQSSIPQSPRAPPSQPPPKAD